MSSSLDVEKFLAARLSEILGLDVREINIQETLFHHGLDSLGAVNLIAELGRFIGRQLSPTLPWQYPTIKALAAYLTTGTKASVLKTQPERAGVEPIAIVGMACRFPKAPNLSAFWRLLCDGVDAVTAPPEERWDLAALYGDDLAAAAKRDYRWGAFLDQVDQFDPLFFGISPREASQLDPQQRLMLELSWEALEDAGIPPHSLKESRTGVYFGVMWPEYAVMLYKSSPAFTQHTVLGSLHCFIPNRVSYVLGLQGPSLAVDSACSSSLTAIHLACESLRRGETTLAITGGVNLNLLADTTLVDFKIGALSADGRCHTFDAHANGYVRGEGAGVAVLKPLSRAILDNDPVYCVIRGSAVNNDGPSNGFSAPNPQAQEAMLRQACSAADISPSEVDYVELHGTGTKLGDPIEAEALGRVLCADRPADRPLLVGSVKTNIGHLEAAAGMAGLIKTALCIKHRIIAPSLNFQTPNPHIREELPLRVQTTLIPWPERERPALAGVSSFGMGGTNAHVVLQAALPPRAELCLLGRASADELRAAQQLLLAQLAAAGPLQPLDTLCSAQLAAGTNQTFRLAATVRSKEALRQSLEGHLAGRKVAGLAAARVDSRPPPKVALILSGGGSQWYGMARRLLLQERVFRREIEQCDRLISHHLGWSLLEELLAPKERSRIDEIDVICAAIVAIEIALVALLRSWGIAPSAVMGHSIGEIAAAHVAGALSRDDAMRVICAQGRILRQIRRQGAMGVIGLGWEAAAAAISRYPGRLFRSIQMSAEATVLSGDQAALDEVFAALGHSGVFCRQVRTEVATHCPRVEPLREAIRDQVRGLKPGPARTPIVSSLTGSWLAGERFDEEHWVRHQAEPVRFAPGIATLIEAGYELFVEISPHPLVRSAIESELKAAGKRGLVLATMQRDMDERGALLDALGAYYTQGLPVHYKALFPELPAPANSADATGSGSQGLILPLSARSPEALVELARAYRDLLADGCALPPQDIAYTASRRRSHHAHRLAVVGNTAQQWTVLLSAFVAGQARQGLAAGRKLAERTPKLVFVFSGHGSQWIGMGRQLLAAEPVFQTLFSTCDALIRKETGCSILEGIMTGELVRFDLIQPAIFALQISLAALWRSWGVIPDAVVGHSMGELAAAYVCGALSLEDAVGIVCRRSRIIDQLSGKDAMVVAELTLEQAQELASGYGDRLAVAISNGPRTTVLSGDAEAAEEALTQLARSGIFCRRVLGVTVASHSPRMEVLRDDIHTALSAIKPRVPALPMYSTVTSHEISAASLDASYWFRNIREPVLFWPTIQRLAELGHQIFVELSPHPVLLPALRDGLAEIGADAVAFGSLRREQPEVPRLLETLAELHVRGIELDWNQLSPAGRCVSLPSYPWQRERYWVGKDRATGPQARRRPAVWRDEAAHPLLGQPFSVSTQPQAHFWEQRLGEHLPSLLGEHRIHGQMVFPGAGYLEMALAAARQVYPQGEFQLEGVRFERMLTLHAEDESTVQTVLFAQGEQGDSIQFSRRQGDQWIRHAAANLRRVGSASPADRAVETPAAIRQRCPLYRGKQELYRQMAEHGGEYGPQFQGVEELWVGRGELLGRLEMPVSVSPTAARYQVHPAWLDACLHVIAGGVRPGLAGLWIPVFIERLRLFAALGKQVFVHALEQGANENSDREVQYSLRVLKADGQCLLQVEGLKLQRLLKESDGDHDTGAEHLYEVKWREQVLSSKGRPDAAKAGPWLILMDRGSTGAQVLAQLRERGETCILVHAGTQYEKLTTEAYRLDPGTPQGYEQLLRDSLGPTGECKGIIHLWSLHSTPAEETTPESLEQDQRLGYLSALHLLQALGRTGWRDPPRIWFVTRGLSPAGEQSSPLSLSQAPLWGLGRVAAVERPELTSCRIDLDGHQTAGEAEALVNELLSGGSENEVALRQGRRYVARLARSSISAAGAGESRAVRGDRTYLITGGLKGLGLAAASWLTELGARHLVLIGRSGPTTDGQDTIARMRSAGAQVVAAQADVARYDQLCSVMAGSARGLPPLGGVIHSAAILDDGLLESQSAERFQRVLAAKVLGTWNLHLLTREEPLDFFLCYSSAASVLGSPGQANYAAANAFLDAFAQQQRRAGRNVTSINWGLFTEAGLMTGDAAAKGRWSSRGMQSLTLAAAKQVFRQLLAAPRAQLAVMNFDARKWLEFYPYLAGSPFWTELQHEPEHAAKAPADQAAPWRKRLCSISPAERGPLLEDLLATQLGRLLSLEPRRVDRQTPFRELGMDSLMHLEVRNHLEASLDIKLPLVILLTYSTIATLAEQLLDRLALAEGPAMDAPMEDQAAEQRPPADKLDQLTDAELLEQLKREMALAKKGSSS